MDVSIHAPVRGATFTDRSSCPADERFNPRPRAGGDSTISIDGKVLQSEFQSTPPCGGRPVDFRWSDTEVAVSIHAPVRGATSWDGTRKMHDKKFQSTPPCGGRPGPGLLTTSALRFQSTPPCGGRQVSGLICRCSQRGFNPRPRAGGDYSLDVDP